MSVIESPKLKMASYGRGLAFETKFSKMPHAKVILMRMKIFIVSKII